MTQTEQPMRIAPRTMLCGDRLASPCMNVAGDRFEELRRVVHRRRGQGVTGHRAWRGW